MRAFLVPLFIFLLIAFVVGASPSCTPLSYQTPTPGSHGYRTWYSTQLRSLTHDNAPICIPEGWKPIGALQQNKTSATFAPHTTAVFIHADSFISKELAFTHSSYVVTLLVAHDTDLSTQYRYEEMARNAFERIGALFNDDSSYTPRTHTIVVTAGLGYIDTEEGSVYPDPGPEVSYLILPPSDPRSEELFIHAIAHLYNRFQDTDLTYQSVQLPTEKSDWQELEASWMETAFLSSDERRTERAASLYRLHSTHTNAIGVRTTSDTSHDDVQYAHYILAPLVMIGTDGLLPASTDVETLLTRVHKEHISFVDLLRTYLSPAQITQIESWMSGNAKIPQDLFLAGLARYE